jgi:hypothetical protein
MAVNDKAHVWVYPNISRDTIAILKKQKTDLGDANYDYLAEHKAVKFEIICSNKS